MPHSTHHRSLLRLLALMAFASAVILPLAAAPALAAGAGAGADRGGNASTSWPEDRNFGPN